MQGSWLQKGKKDGLKPWDWEGQNARHILQICEGQNCLTGSRLCLKAVTRLLAHLLIRQLAQTVHHQQKSTS